MRPANGPVGDERYPFHVMVKPTGAVCNLDCSYCYYLSKEALYPGSRFRMSEPTLEQFVRSYVESQPDGEVVFAWQGGEPTLMGLDFFRRILELERRYARPGMRIRNSIQTNGTLLDDAWGRFLAENAFLVGISIDGPQDLHDAFRTDKGGAGSHARVLKGLAVLKDHGVDFNVLTTVHSANVTAPLRVYRYLRDDIGATFVQFIPIVEPSDEASGPEPRSSGRSITGQAYGRFLTTIYDEWITRDVGSVYVQLFDVTLGKYVGEPGGLCVFEETCGNALALEHNGDVYSCDHFVTPEHLLGNLTEIPLVEMAQGERQRAFGDAKRDGLPEACRTCDVRWLCHGGCPKNRLMQTSDGEDGLNVLCAGYLRFFHHTRQTMEAMANELRHRRAPANIMERLQTRPRRNGPDQGTSRNRPCPCGSGRKYKHCCGRSA